MRTTECVDDILARQLVGEALAADEQQSLDKYIQEHNNEFAKMESLMNDLEGAERIFSVDTAAAWQKVEARLEVEKKPTLLRRLYPVLAVAASLLLLFGIGTMVYNQFFTTDVTFANATQTIKTITLPDGSTVKLSPNAELAYTESDGTRNVELKGKAFFDVKHQDEPFAVETGELKVEVLGTSFTIDSEKAANQEVTVATGRVRVTSGNDDVVLTKGERVSYEAGKLSDVKKSDSKVTNVSLVLENTPITTVIAQLESEMDMKIDLGEGLDNNKITTRLSLSNPSNVVKELSLLCNCKYDSISPLHFKMYR